MMYCYDLVYYKPRLRWVIGITNWDRCENVYRLIFELDTHEVDLDALFYETNVAIIIKTRRGYHVYTKEKYANIDEFDARLSELVKKGLADEGYYELLQARKKDGRFAYTVLRVSPKYSRADLKVYFASHSLDLWLKQVLELIYTFNRHRYHNIPRRLVFA